jgi:hypothetical protein
MVSLFDTPCIQGVVDAQNILSDDIERFELTSARTERYSGPTL